MIVNAIVACTPNGIIGVNGKLPFYCPEDLKRFKQLTMGKPVIMGRKTFESIGKPLPGRLNIVVSRKYSKSKYDTITEAEDGLIFADNVEVAVLWLLLAGTHECFIIGGEQIYRAAEPHLRRIYKTIIHRPIDKIFVGDEVARWPIKEDSNWQLAVKDRIDDRTNLIYVRRNLCNNT